MNFISKLTRFILPALIIALSIAGYGMLKVEEQAVEKTTVAERVWPVETQVIEKKTITPTVQLFGRVVSSGTARLSSILNAEVLEVHVRPGDFVEKEDVLVELNTRNIETRIAQLEADVARIEAQLESEMQRHQADQEVLEHEKKLLELANQISTRIETLKSRNLESQSRFERAQTSEQQANLAVTARLATIRGHDARVQRLNAELERTRASLANARSDFRDSAIVAPFSGRISDVYVAARSRVNHGALLVEMFDHEAIEVQTLIPNQYLSRIRRSNSDSPVLSAIAIVDGETLKLEFDRLAAKVDDTRGGVDAYIRVVNGSYYPELGRTVNILLSLSPVESAVAIPYQSIYGSDHVFKVADDRLQSVQIDRHGQITSDGKQFMVAKSMELNSGDMLVTTPLTNAVDGLKVDPVSAN